MRFRIPQCDEFMHVVFCEILRTGNPDSVPIVGVGATTNKYQELLWAQRVKTLQETITLADKRKSLLVIQIQEALWRKLNNLKKKEKLWGRRGIFEPQEFFFFNVSRE